MKLILLKPIRGLGNVGDIVTVAMGYARNFLMPKGFAIRATIENQKDILERKVQLELESVKQKEIASNNIKEYVNKYFTFIKNASYEGKLFGGISSKEIAESISTELLQFKADNIYLNSPIKKIGIHTAILSLHPQVECKIFINVAKTQEEADLALVDSSISSD
jgi:large subunit ribosomal protein L9